MRHATIKIRTDAPDCSDIPVKMHDWEHSCCADAKEEIPLDAPKPNRKPVTMTKVAAPHKAKVKRTITVSLRGVRKARFHP